MKNVILILFLFIALPCFAGPRVVGNGGDILSPLPIGQADLITAIKQARPSLRFWLYRLESEWRKEKRTGNILKTSSFEIPLGTRKLFSSHLGFNVYELMDSMIFSISWNSYCDGKHGQSDGATILNDPLKICLSGYSLIPKLNRDNLKVQIEGLILHEVAHLMEADEFEAVALQKRYVTDMGELSHRALSSNFSIKFATLQRAKLQRDPIHRKGLLVSLRQSETNSIQFFSPDDMEKIMSAVTAMYFDYDLIPVLKAHLKSDMETQFVRIFQFN